MDIINVKNLSKSYRVAKRNSGFGNAIKSFFKREYKIVNAVSDMTFTIKKGEMVGYIGPNGAGKSTTIKMLSGILKPDSGNIMINGLNPVNDRKNMLKKLVLYLGRKVNYGGIFQLLIHLTCLGIFMEYRMMNILKLEMNLLVYLNLRK